MPHKQRRTLAEMAADTAGVIENLGLDSAHVVGISLGGMIAQILAIERPERVRSLTSIMSMTGNGRVGQPTEAARALLLLPPVSTRAGAMDRSVLFKRAVGSPAYRIDETELRDRAARAFDQAFDPQGVVRQLAAAMATQTAPKTCTGSTCRPLLFTVLRTSSLL